jgi:hypothetical protein
MSYNIQFPLKYGVAAAVGLAAFTAVPLLSMTRISAQTRFPDTEGYWAQPFIEVLAEAGIVAGYPDGTFRPAQTLSRDEYAAMLRQAFQLDQEREIASGSTFADVPEGYWATEPIETAYEAGVMGTLEENQFYPQAPLTRVEAIAATADSLELTSRPSTTAAQPQEEQPTQTEASTAAQAPAATPTQQRAKQRPQRQLMFPLASVSLMRLFAPPAPAAATQPSAADPSAQEPEEPVAAAPQTQQSAPIAADTLGQYYQDAEQIPEYARGPVAAATEAGLVVNYPEPSQLNPNAPLERGAAAAMIHQAMVQKGRLEPLPEESQVSGYIVQPTAPGNN